MSPTNNNIDSPTALPAPPPKPVKLRNLSTGEMSVDSLHMKYKHNNKSHACNELRCLGSMINPRPVEHRVRNAAEIFEHAKEFMANFFASIKRLDSAAHRNRLAEIEQQLKTTETYYLKETELIYGAKLAWRNASRCIGRIQWSKLQVFDARFTTTANDMFEALCNHIKYATNKGSLRSAITIMPQRVKSTRNDWRIWNSQLIGYAGYRQTRDLGNGAKQQVIVGDPANADFTEVCQKLGWQGKGGRFDVLPLVLQAQGQPPQVFTLPEDIVLRIKIKHPKLDWFEQLGLEWYALPAVANMMLDVGGLQFTAAPFSGWYMVTEVGTRDLGDPKRYNVLEQVAQRMGLSTTSNTSLWRDQAIVQLNIAVLDSFQSAGVTIVDHHTACETFMTHLANEQRLRGGCPADWVWLVPPTSGSATQVFHQEMVNYHLLPNYEYMEPVWKNYDFEALKRQQAEQAAKLQQQQQQAKEAAAAAQAAKQQAAAAAAAAGSLTVSPAATISGSMVTPPSGNGVASSPMTLTPMRAGELTPRKLRFKEIARAVKFTSKLFGKALSRRIKATILYATETGKSERFANKLAQTFSCAFNVHLMSMSDYDMTCLEHEALLLIVTSTFGNGDPPENGELFAKHLAAVKLTGDTSPDLDSINSVSTNPFFQMLSEDHKDGVSLASFDELSETGASMARRIEQLSSLQSVHQQSLDQQQQQQQQQQPMEEMKREHETNIKPLSNVRFGVFALGSMAYPHFCAFGRYVDQTLAELGAERILKCTCGDELSGQEKAFNEWSQEVFKIACDVFCLTDSIGPLEERPEMLWSPEDVRFVPVELIGTKSDAAQDDAAKTPGTPKRNKFVKNQELLASKKTVARNLANITNKRIIAFTMSDRRELHKFWPEENLQTLCIDLSSELIAPMQSSTARREQQQANKQQQQTAQSAQSQQNKAAPAECNSAPPTPAPAPLISFEPGDHVAIYPTNKPDIVQRLVDRMLADLKRPQAANSCSQTKSNTAKSFNFDQVHTILVRRENMDLTPAGAMTVANGNAHAQHNGTADEHSSDSDNEQQCWIPHDRLPVTSVRDALTRYLDITSPPSQEFLSMLSRQTSDSDERKRLQLMARNFTCYEEWKNRNFPCLLSVLDEFTSVRFDPALVTQLPLMMPRFYSVSGVQVSLTVGVVRFKTRNGELKEGLCSNYLNRAPTSGAHSNGACVDAPPHYIFGYVRSAPAFHMPADQSLPLILISAGTGIAPFRSFWQQRYLDMFGRAYVPRHERRRRHRLQARSETLTASATGAQNGRATQSNGELDADDDDDDDDNNKLPASSLTQAKRSVLRKLYGRMDLYFGCRNSNYILYKDELDEMLECGVLSSVNIAFSRPLDGDLVPANVASTDSQRVGNIRQVRRKMYVQDRLLEQAEQVYKNIILGGAHVYVCGDVAMAAGVYRTLVTIFNNTVKLPTQNGYAANATNNSANNSSSASNSIAKLATSRSFDDGESVLMNMRNMNRYHEDIFGAKQTS